MVLEVKPRRDSRLREEVSIFKRKKERRRDNMKKVKERRRRNSLWRRSRGGRREGCVYALPRGGDLVPTVTIGRIFTYRK